MMITAISQKDVYEMPYRNIARVSNIDRLVFKNQINNHKEN